MDRVKFKKKALNFEASVELAEKVEKRAVEMGLSRSDIIRLALSAYLKEKVPR